MGAAISLQAVFAGLLASFVGFASSFAIILHGLTAVGATQAEAASGLMAVSIAMGIGGIYLSLKNRLPISIAWSTPGAALLASIGVLEGGFSVAIGSFLVCGVLILLSGLWKPLGRWVAAIPSPLANAMLAGVLLDLCLAPAWAIAEFPVHGLVIVITWAIVARLKRLLAVPAAVLAMALLLIFTLDVNMAAVGSLWPDPVFIAPEFSLGGVIGIAVPLFIVTMAGQNIPGMAVLTAHGYKPDASPIFRDTGIISILAAPFGSHAVNLAAITAALCANEDAHPDPARRYWSAITSGAMYIVYGLLAGAATAFVSASPPVLIEAVAGLALLGTLGMSLMGAVKEPDDREAAVITFIVTASGLSFYGIGGAFWGLIAGGLVLALTRWKRA